MTFNNNNNNYQLNTALGVAGPGFGARGKANGLKRLNLASPPKLGSVNENGVDETPTPRTSRSYLLAGLRTAPKTPSVPSSAPYSQTQHNGMEQARYAQPVGNNMSMHAPHTAMGNSFPLQYGAAGQQFYHLPEQVLAPPQLDPAEVDEDPQWLAQLQATKSMLAMRQQLLQQQLANLTAQQFASMNLRGNQMFNGLQTPMTPHLGLYQQQLLAGVQPVVTEVPGQPGLYTVYNPLTGQTTLAADTSRQQEPQLAHSPSPPTPGHGGTGFYAASAGQRHTSPQRDGQNVFSARSISPPNKTPSPPVNVEPLPPPSANAFRHGHHKKVSSLALNNTTPVADGPKSSLMPRSHAMPHTPLTGTFGPGQGRAGEHPSRQPRGPPAMEELKAKPTAKHAGSKNFAARQRRAALSNIVKAGRERLARPGSGSAGSTTPVSESELTFSVPSDTESGSGRSSPHGVIGSERKASRERLNQETNCVEPAKRVRTPLLALANAAEQRKSLCL